MGALPLPAGDPEWSAGELANGAEEPHIGSSRFCLAAVGPDFAYSASGGAHLKLRGSAWNPSLT